MSELRNLQQHYLNLQAKVYKLEQSNKLSLENISKLNKEISNKEDISYANKILKMQNDMLEKNYKIMSDMNKSLYHSK